MTECSGVQTQTGNLWKDSSERRVVEIEEKYLSEEGKELLKQNVKDVVYDEQGKRFLIIITNEKSLEETRVRIRGKYEELKS